MKRRPVVLGAAAFVSAPAILSGCAQRSSASPGGSARVLRVAFPVAETGFDPAQISDIYSRTVAAHVFEAPYEYDHLARPFALRPCTAAAMPQVAHDFRTFTIALRPGIHFAEDAAFGGRPRELTAADYVYSIKRHFDPATKSPSLSSLAEAGIVGLDDLRARALATGRFDYDRPIEGLQAPDRHTLRIRLREPRPRFLFTLAVPDVIGAVAREVVEAHGDRVMEHPVGTGPFKLAHWRRSSRIVLERNARYRDRFYDATPGAADAEGRALVERFRGRRLPMIDGVEVSIVEEAQPRWLAFLNGEHDVLERLPNEFAGQAIPGGELAPHLAKRSIRKHRVAASDTTLTVFNMEHPAVGGHAPEQVALRRAVALGLDIDREIRLVRRGEAVRAQSLVPPLSSGYDPELVSEMGTYDVARAQALLDLYGYADRDGDGWRERPDGSPLVLELATQSDSVSRQSDELWKKDVERLGLRVRLQPAQWPENLKAVRNGRFMLWRVGSSSTSPDGQGALERCYGPSVGRGNLARFRLADFDAVYERMKSLPDGNERDALFREAAKLVVAYCPYRVHVHRIVTDLVHARVAGYRRPPFWLGWWHRVDVQTPAA